VMKKDMMTCYFIALIAKKEAKCLVVSKEQKFNNTVVVPEEQVHEKMNKLIVMMLCMSDSLVQAQVN
jgi:hypothetical protein